MKPFDLGGAARQGNHVGQHLGGDQRGGEEAVHPHEAVPSLGRQGGLGQKGRHPL